MFPFFYPPYGAQGYFKIEYRVGRRRNRDSPARNIVHNGNRDSPAPPNAARINGNPPADNAARNNRVSPMADIARMSGLHVEQGGSWYFAYGSNMHVSQMADRCPRSRFVGAASLPGYRWQINEKGIANIVPSPNDRVEGLVYLLEREDEKSLDRIEAVSKKLYARQRLRVDLTPHQTLCAQKSWLVAAELARQSQPGQGNNAVVVGQGDANLAQIQHNVRPGRVKVLVYISEQYKVDGAIRSEYINRMQKAMADGLTLGIPASYVEKCLSPLVNPRPKVPAHKRIEPRRQGSR
ncbi:hypothetical protein NHJ13734_009308 [Beauveria thailandica]